MEKKETLWIFDAGHGGILAGEYMTPPEDGRYVEYDDFTIYEGEVVRRLASYISSKAKKEGIKTLFIDTQMCLPLSLRVDIANDIYLRYHKSVFVSLHSNMGKGNGVEIFTSIGKTKSDDYATGFMECFAEDFPYIKQRHDWSDGDCDKEADFYILKNTIMPAFLFELLFIDNYREAQLLKDDSFLMAVSNTFIKFLTKYDKL
jgi:N-acetylmuramoyl-L-alanine amidase